MELLLLLAAGGITAYVVWTVLTGDGREAERAAAREAAARDPESAGPHPGEVKARTGSALRTVSERLPMLGAQAGFQLPPPPEGVPVDEVDDRYTESVEGWEEPPGGG